MLWRAFTAKIFQEGFRIGEMLRRQVDSSSRGFGRLGDSDLPPFIRRPPSHGGFPLPFKIKTRINPPGLEM